MNLAFEIDRLQQIVIEDEFSRKNIRKQIISDIKSSLNTSLKIVYAKCLVEVEKYMTGSYYRSKQNRIQCIAHIPNEEIVAEIFMAVIPLQKETVIQGVAAKIGHYFEYEDIFDGVKTASEILGACVDTGLYDINVANPHGLPHLNIISHYSLDHATTQFIENTQYLNPMVTPPKDWNNNRDGGYISFKQSLILGKNTHHDEDQALDAINIIQKIEWEIDTDILALEEEPGKPLDTVEKRESFLQMKRMTKRVCHELTQLGNRFWFVWRPDFRGRYYSQGHWINFQASSYRKALLNFKHKEVIK